MPNFTRESGGTLHVAVMGVNRIGKKRYLRRMVLNGLRLKSAFWAKRVRICSATYPDRLWRRATARDRQTLSYHENQPVMRPSARESARRQALRPIFTTSRWHDCVRWWREPAGDVPRSLTSFTYAMADVHRDGPGTTRSATHPTHCRTRTSFRLTQIPSIYVCSPDPAESGPGMHRVSEGVYACLTTFAAGQSRSDVD